VRSLYGVEEFPGVDRGIKEITSNDIRVYRDRKTPHEDTGENPMEMTGENLTFHRKFIVDIYIQIDRI
jgi:hypothetical protein